VANIQLCYYLRMPAGYVKAKAVVQAQGARKPRLRLRIIKASSGDTILDHSSEGTASASVQNVDVMPETKIPEDTWYRFELSSPSTTGISMLRQILFNRESTLPVKASDIFMAPSTHLFTYGTTEPYAPRQNVEGNDWCYMEVMYPQKYERPNTYVMSLGVLSGYMGIQSIINSDKKTYNHHVLFSMWDNGDTDKDSNLPSYMRSGALDTGVGVQSKRFGGEGTGTQAMMKGNWWSPDNWVQFITHCRPEDVNVTIKGSKGQDSVITYHNTIVSAWYKEAQASEWHYIATLRESGRNHYYGGWYSFIENFTDAGGEFYRRAYFKNPYMRSMASGKWYVRNTVSYGHTQNTGARNSRTDYGHGATDAFPNCFYLETGGYGSVNDSANTFKIVRNSECVDTINLQALLERENIAIRNDRVAALETDLANATRSEGSTLAGVKAIAAKMIKNADCLGNYRKEDLATVISTYDNGNATDAAALRNAIINVGQNCTPLKFSTLSKKEHISSFRAYQLKSAKGLGTVVATTTDGQPGFGLIKTDKEETCNATDSMNNWMLIHTEKDDKYYLYNIGLKKYLDFSQSTSFSDVPAEVDVTKTSSGFRFVSNGYYLSAGNGSSSKPGKSAATNNCYFNLIDNIAMQPAEADVNRLLKSIERYAEYQSNKNSLGAVTDLPEGVVGYITSASDRAAIKKMTDNGNMTFEQWERTKDFIDSVPAIRFEPAKSLYRIRLTTAVNNRLRYLTTSGSQSVYGLSADNTFDQIWQFTPATTGYTLTSQGKGIAPFAATANARVTVTDKDNADPVLLTDLGHHNYALTPTSSPTYGIGALSSVVKTAAVTTSAAQWYLEPVGTVSVSLNGGGMGSICADFDLTMPEGLTACTVDSVSDDGLISLDTIKGGTVPAGTPVLLLGGKNATYELTATPAVKSAALSGNMLGGVLHTANFDADSCYVLTMDGDINVMKPNQDGSIESNTAYLPKAQNYAGLSLLKFKAQLPTGIRSVGTQADGSEKMYDLMGRPVTGHYKGIVISKGKKRIEK
jgi:hypothetical protein